MHRHSSSRQLIVAATAALLAVVLIAPGVLYAQEPTPASSYTVDLPSGGVALITMEVSAGEAFVTTVLLALLIVAIYDRLAAKVNLWKER